MTVRKISTQQWPDDKVKKYLDGQYPDQQIEWIVFDESGLYGFNDPGGYQFACADDDELRNRGITEFLIRNGGSYISNNEISDKQ